jgi:hypothetical protein
MYIVYIFVIGVLVVRVPSSFRKLAARVQHGYPIECVNMFIAIFLPIPWLIDYYISY